MAATVESIRALAKAPPMRDMKARQQICDAARELMYAVEPPIEMENRIFFAGIGSSSVNIANDLNVFGTLAADVDKQWSVQELATKVGADPILLHRILRHLSTTNLISEPQASTYSASHLTSHLASRRFIAGLKHNTHFVNPPFTALPSVLQENNYRNLSGGKTCAFQKGLGTDDDIMEYLTRHPEIAKYTFEYMASHKDTSVTWMDGSVPLGDFQLSASDVEKNRVLMVDVGGGSGHQPLGLRRAQPELKGRMVVQDVPLMIDQIDKSAAAAAGVEVMVHDFCTPQPIRGAKVYYLRSVLHDWPDEKCQTILSHLRDAMAEDSVIAIDEIVIPAQGASAMQTHFDLTMLAAVGAMERSEAQWAELLKGVGLRIREISIYDRGLSGGFIVAVAA